MNTIKADYSRRSGDATGSISLPRGYKWYTTKSNNINYNYIVEKENKTVHKVLDKSTEYTRMTNKWTYGIITYTLEESPKMTQKYYSGV